MLRHVDERTISLPAKTKLLSYCMDACNFIVGEKEERWPREASIEEETKYSVLDIDAYHVSRPM